MDSGKIHLTVFQCKFCQITLNIVSAFRKKTDKNGSRKMQKLKVNKDEIGIFVMKESEF